MYVSVTCMYLCYIYSVFLSIQNRGIYHYIKIKISYQERLWICERNDPGLGTAEVTSLHIHTTFKSTHLPLENPLNYAKITANIHKVASWDGNGILLQKLRLGLNSFLHFTFYVLLSLSIFLPLDLSMYICLLHQVFVYS